MSDLFHEDVPAYFIGMVFAVMALAPKHTYMILTKRPDRMEELLAKPTGEFWVAIRVNLMRTGYVFPPMDERSILPLPNVWLGVSVEDQATADARIPLLLHTPAAVRFVSYEPALGPVDFYKACSGLESHLAPQFSWFKGRGLDWIIMGGESGPGARPMHPDWARSVRDQCQAAGVPFFFKQLGEWTNEYPQRSLKYIQEDFAYGSSFWRVGKKEAGRLLDGREWNEFPEVRR